MNKKLIDNTDAHDALVLRHKDEVEDVWGFAKDGKTWWGKEWNQKEMRK